MELQDIEEIELTPQMIQKRSDRASPALRGLLDTLLEPARSASSSNGWKGFVFMDPLFKVQRSQSSSASLLPPPSVPSSPSFQMDSPQYETESAPIPYIIEPPMDMYQPMASNTRYATAKRPYDDYYDEEENSEPISRVRSRKVKQVTTTTTKKPSPTPAISIGPASGGGTAIRLGKAKITFKKGSISLGPVDEHETESKRLLNNEKSSEKATKRPYHNYEDDAEINDFVGTSSSSSRHQTSDNRDRDRNIKGHGDGHRYSEDDYGPKYAKNYKTSASGSYQSYKPYHNLDTLIDKQVNPNQGKSNYRHYDEDSNNFSPQPIYKGNVKSNVLTTSVTESYLTKSDYDYEDSVVITERPRKKARDKRRDETVVEEDNEEENEDKVVFSSSKLAGKQEQRRKNSTNKRSESSGKDSDPDEDESKIATVNNDDESSEDIDTSTEKAPLPLSSTIRPLRRKSSTKPKSDSTTATTTKLTTSRNTQRNKVKTPKASAKQESAVPMDEVKLIKEHREDEADHSVNHEEDDESGGEERENKRINSDSEEDDEDDRLSKLSIQVTTPLPTSTTTTKIIETKKRKSNSRQNARRKQSNRTSVTTPKPDSISTLSGRQSVSKASEVDTVYIGNRGQSVRTQKQDTGKHKKGSIESVSILPGASSSDRGTIVTLKMSDDPSLGIIGGSTNARKPGSIYQIRLTSSRIPTEPAIVTKVSNDAEPIDIAKDENSLNRLIKMMQDTLEDIRKSSSASSLPSTTITSSSPCPPSKNDQPITEPSTPRPLPPTLPATIKPVVDPFLNLHHSNITVLPASMGNVSDIVEMLVQTSKMGSPKSPLSSLSTMGEKSVSDGDKKTMTLIKDLEIITNSNNGEDNMKKVVVGEDYSIDLDNSNQSINNAERPQAEESRTKGLKQNFSPQPNSDESSNINQNEPNKQINDQSNDGNNGDDVPIIVVLLPPEEDIARGFIN